MTDVIINLTRGLIARIDEHDYPKIAGMAWQAHARRDGKGYYAVSSDGVRMHRLLLDASDSDIVDHRDGDGLNNTRRNLRKGTQSQNCVNRRTTPGGYMRGARPKKGKWQAYIKFQGKQRSLGYFNTEQEAHAAYLEEARKLHGDWMPLPPAPGSVLPPTREPTSWPFEWRLTDAEDFTVKLSLAMHKHVPGWGGATDEQLDAIAKDVLPTAPPRDEVVEALRALGTSAEWKSKRQEKPPPDAEGSGGL